MTEEEWLTATEPTTMLDSVVEFRVGSRKRTLFYVSYCRRLSQFYYLDHEKFFSEVEDFIDGDSTVEDVEAVLLSLNMSGLNNLCRSICDYALCQTHSGEPFERTWEAVEELANYGLTLNEHGDECFGEIAVNHERNIQAAMLREIYGNPFRPLTFKPSWLTSTVLALANGIYSEKAFDRMPILADALQDAGCDSEVILNHCRQSGEHVRGCWVVDLLLNKE